MTGLPIWAERLYNHPLALDRFTNNVLCEFAQQRIAGTKPTKITAEALDMTQPRAMADEASFYVGSERRSYRSKDGIAWINVYGKLVQRGGWIDAESGLIGYDTIMDQARAAYNAKDIKGIWIAYDSGGGECAGMFEAAEELATFSKAEGGKPIYSWLDERACSAAYVMACAGDKIFGRQEAQGGSISAIINIVDSSKAYEKLGLEAIQIRPEWADRKARGQDGEKIDSDTIKMLTALVDEASEMIVEFVSAMRGISVDAVKALRGEVFTGSDLVKYGLMDSIITKPEAWKMLEDEAASA